MHISVTWHGNNFNVNLHSKEGVDEFLSVKGCRIVTYGEKEFISFPSRKNEETGKYWNHVWASDKFQAVVIDLAKQAQPKQEPPKQGGPFANMKDDIPF